MLVILLLFLFLHILPNYNATEGPFDDNINTAIITGAYNLYLKDIIPYESTIPLTYQQEWDLNSFQPGVHSPNNSSFCHSDRKGSPFYVQACTLFNILSSQNKFNQDMLYNEAHNYKMFESYFHTHQKRVGRGIKMFGDFFDFCCDVATKRSLKSLYHNQNEVNTAINDIHQLISGDHKDLINFSKQLNNYTQVISQKINSLNSEFIKTNYKVEFAINNIQKEMHMQVIDILNSMINVQNLIHYMTVLHHYDAILSDCKLNKIPLFLLPSSQLTQDLVKLQLKLDKHGRELAISPKYIDQYYIYELAECTYNENAIALKVNIPIKTSTLHFKFYNFLTIPFAYHNYTCRIHNQHKYFAVEQTTKSMRFICINKHCDPSSTNLCLLPQAQIEYSNNAKCIKLTFQDAPVERLKQLCTFECVPFDHRPIITTVAHGIFILTHFKPPISIHNLITNQTSNIPTSLFPHGAIMIKLPCFHEVYHGEQIIIQEQFPCESSHPSHLSLNFLLPSAWTKLSNIRYASTNTLTMHPEFKTSLDLYNENWTMSTPHFVLSNTIDPHMLHNISLHNPVANNIFGSDFISDIIYLTWLSAITISLVVLCYFIIQLSFKLNVLVTSLQAVKNEPMQTLVQSQQESLKKNSANSTETEGSSYTPFLKHKPIPEKRQYGIIGNPTCSCHTKRHGHS